MEAGLCSLCMPSVHWALDRNDPLAGLPSSALPVIVRMSPLSCSRGYHLFYFPFKGVWSMVSVGHTISVVPEMYSCGSEKCLRVNWIDLRHQAPNLCPSKPYLDVTGKGTSGLKLRPPACLTVLRGYKTFAHVVPRSPGATQTAVWSGFVFWVKGFGFRVLGLVSFCPNPNPKAQEPARVFSRFCLSLPPMLFLSVFRVPWRLGLPSEALRSVAARMPCLPLFRALVSGVQVESVLSVVSWFFILRLLFRV